MIVTKLENGRLFESLFMNLINGCAHCQAVYLDGKLVDYIHLLTNKSLETISGLHDTIGKKSTEFLPTLRYENPLLWNVYERVSKGGSPETFEEYIVPLNIWLKLSVYCVEIGTFTVVFEDVSEHKHVISTLEKAKEEIEEAYEESLSTLMRTLEFRDVETKEHSNRVSELTVDLAKKYYHGNLSPQDVIYYKRGAQLHDIGKIFLTNDKILNKNGTLDAEERDLMEQHALLSYEFLKPMKFISQIVINIPHYHHEAWDGSGYPEGLTGNEIPVCARIFTVADVYDAMTSDRPYRKRFSRKFVLKYIDSQSGILFDPSVVKAFLSIME